MFFKNYGYNLLMNEYPKLDKFKIIYFLKDLRFKKQKYSRNNITLNLFFLINMLNSYKIKKRIIFFRTVYNIYNQKKLILNPSFTFLSQFFEYRSIFLDVLKKNNVEGFFIYKNLFKNTGYYYEYTKNYLIYIGYNFYVINNSQHYFTVLNEIFKSKDYNNVGKVKLFDQFYVDNFNFNYYFLYNFFLLNTLEIYKIIILLYFNKI